MAKWQSVVDATRYEAGIDETLNWYGRPTMRELEAFCFETPSTDDAARAYKRGRLANHFAYEYAAMAYVTSCCP